MLTKKEIPLDAGRLRIVVNKGGCQGSEYQFRMDYDPIYGYDKWG